MTARNPIEDLPEPGDAAFNTAQLSLSYALDACQALREGPALTDEAASLLLLYVKQLGHAVDRAR